MGHEVTVGRHGDLLVGVAPEDTGVSRQALAVSVADEGWMIRATNANGAVICPWGQPSRWAESDRETWIRWPLVGVRIIGTDPELVHWVLLENPGFSVARQPAVRDQMNTSVGPLPTPLTDPQLEALRAVFAQYLTWPPVAGPAPMTLQSAARRLGVSQAAVFQRLEAVRARAYQFGSPQQVGVSDPEYVFVLARAGYIPVPDIRLLDKR
jgi:hypothetical protein